MTARRHQGRRPNALALAIERQQWERIVLHAFVALAEALEAERNVTIDDLIALLEGAQRTHER
jgi:hypothetical protein